MSAILETMVANEIREVAMGLRKEWEERAKARGREKGREEGREQSREEGRREGRDEMLARVRQMVRKQLRLRFGELGADDEARVARATMDELDHWTERILTSDTLDAVWA